MKPQSPPITIYMQETVTMWFNMLCFSGDTLSTQLSRGAKKENLTFKHVPYPERPAVYTLTLRASIQNEEQPG